MIRNHVGGNFQQSEASQRLHYYPQTHDPPGYYTPTFWVAGLDEQTGVWSDVEYTESIYSGMIANWQAIPTPLEINLQVEYDDMAATGTVRVEVTADGFVGFNELYLRIAITESGINYNQEMYNQVLRDYLPNPMGIPVIVDESTPFVHTEDFAIDPGWDPAECDVVAFVQNDTEKMMVQCVTAEVPAITPVAWESPQASLPDRYRLSQNYPNPFNPETEIRYTIPRDERVTLKVYNVAGAEVATLVEGQQAAGSYSARWNAVGFASGVYFCRLQAGKYSETVKMALMR
ncbi:Omp28-related outer membrane protein [Candidatus Zixiibacteriota bacterium]